VVGDGDRALPSALAASTISSTRAAPSSIGILGVIMEVDEVLGHQLMTLSASDRMVPAHGAQ